MSLIYFPSCKFTAQFPEISDRVKKYLRDSHGAEIAGCCRATLDRITDRDTVVYICNTCAAFSKESSAAGKVISVWELLAGDTAFSWPESAPARMTLQDCWRSHDNPKQHEAVRQVMRNMGIDIIEQKDNREKARFCGATLYDTLPARYGLLAPKLLVEDAEGFFQPHSDAEKERLMREHCRDIATPEVACYCIGCVKGVNLGGKKGVHLAELAFPAG